MKRIVLSLWILTLGTVCYSQTFNQEITNAKGVRSLTGKINFEKLNSDPYNTWFTKNYDAYSPNEKIISTIKDSLQEYTIQIFMGTWCGDSKREVPRFYKTLNTAGFPLDRLTCIAVQADREHYKQSIGGEHEGLNIHRVPTFIFYKDGKEVNRIVEEPIKTLEADIKEIISKSYVPNYSGVARVHEIIAKKGVNSLSKDVQLISNLKNELSSIYELNTYANVLFFDGNTIDAIEVLKLNTLLFPKESDAYISLANKFLITNNMSEAITNYERSLEIKEDSEISKRVEELKKSL
ncbi:hypothetical protein GCM10009430_41770 [Aquimarina litoralis]|uniref:Thioredoxin n=1 Tax=Aquimarina litoralis TaxID=584605 RepID=A0ABN1J6T9_9FLAO